MNGNYSLTLVDVLDTFVTLNDPAGFDKAVRQVIENVSFDVDTKPQVFEVTIRALGALLSAHIFATDGVIRSQYKGPSEHKHMFSSFVLPWYRGELLGLALDLGRRLLPAFDTPTNLPYARVSPWRQGFRLRQPRRLTYSAPIIQVNLRRGVPPNETSSSCTAGAGSLILEFTALSRLTSDPTFEDLAKKAYWAIWARRSPLNLVGNSIDISTGDWNHPLAGGIGAGIDSFYE